MSAYDWNGNGSSDAFDSYMDMKASGEIYEDSDADRYNSVSNDSENKCFASRACAV